MVCPRLVGHAGGCDGGSHLALKDQLPLPPPAGGDKRSLHSPAQPDHLPVAARRAPQPDPRQHDVGIADHLARRGPILRPAQQVVEGALPPLGGLHRGPHGPGCRQGQVVQRSGGAYKPASLQRLQDWCGILEPGYLHEVAGVDGRGLDRGKDPEYSSLRGRDLDHTVSPAATADAGRPRPRRAAAPAPTPIPLPRGSAPGCPPTPRTFGRHLPARLHTACVPSRARSG
jgi:hypothetical protein